MLVDINLLPKKERKNFTLYIILAVLASVFLLGTSISIIYGNSLKKEAKLLSQQLTEINQNIELEQAQMNTVQETNSILELKNAVAWAEEYPIKAVPVLNHLTSLLPERGFILQYTYNEAGAVRLSVQFDTSREAAQFLQWLTDSEWIKEANILSLGLASQSEITGENQTDMNEYIPRYIGEFDISLEREKVKELILNEQGGDS